MHVKWPTILEQSRPCSPYHHYSPGMAEWRAEAIQEQSSSSIY